MVARIPLYFNVIVSLTTACMYFQLHVGYAGCYGNAVRLTMACDSVSGRSVILSPLVLVSATLFLCSSFYLKP